MRFSLADIVAFVCLPWTLTASVATVVFDNGEHTSATALASSGQEIADDFSFASSTHITGFQWKGVYANGTADENDNFVIRIYNAAPSGGPTNPPGSSQIMFAQVGAISRVDTGAKVGGLEIYQYFASIPTFFGATAGTTYWLDIYNSATNDQWLWSSDNAAGNDVKAVGSTWAVDDNDAALNFQLTNESVPEPSTITLLAIGAIGLLAPRLRGMK